jgi:uncharacterized membrane protein YGL010W
MLIIRRAFMKNIEEQLSSYKSVHFNKKNIQTHFVGVPIIVLSIVVLLSRFTWGFSLGDYSLNITPAFIAMLLALAYYFTLHTRLAVAMGLYLTVTLYLAALLAPLPYSLELAIGLFIIGWIIQFVGHYYEKAKPAFVDDLSQFLIGPLFLMAEVFFALGLEKTLEKNVTKIAQRKRHDFEQLKSKS